MAIIIKEIVVKTTVENKTSLSSAKEKQLTGLKAEIIREVKSLLKKELLRNTGR